MNFESGRQREAIFIHQANRAAAVGRLLLGEVGDWNEFLQADTVDLEKLPRRQLKSGRSDVKDRLSREIRQFCSKNFKGMDMQKLSLLYEDIKAYRGLELPLGEFEEKYAPVRHEVLGGNPTHLTISISLWGLQLKFPEDQLSSDLIEALNLTRNTQKDLKTYETMTSASMKRNKTKINSLMCTKYFASRSVLLCSFNLIEAYLNGLAWDYLQTHDAGILSNRKLKLLNDSSSVSIRDKLEKYPEIVTNRSLWKGTDDDLHSFVEIIKPFRDSLVHPSPFSAPERFGGYDKLRLFYRIDYDTAEVTFHLLINLLQQIHKHVYGDVSLPGWMRGLLSYENET